MNVITFAAMVTNCTVEQKTNALKRIERAVITGIDPTGDPVKEETLPALKALVAWLNVNILIGEELCPASSVVNYLK